MSGLSKPEPAAAHAEIAGRYQKRRHRPNLSALRVRELNLLLTCRYGGERLPDTPDVRRAIVIVGHHLAALPQDPRTSVPNWISLRTPWYSVGDTEALVHDVITNRKRWKAYPLGWQLKLSAHDRTKLRIRTIGAYDLPPNERKKRRRLNDAARKAAARRAKGAKTRAAYLATSTCRSRPWEALGMSRRTWYRKGCPNA